MEIKTIKKLSEVWESREDQNVHASPKGAHTQHDKDIILEFLLFFQKKQKIFLIPTF
jgi:hypothetical protein